MARMTTKAVCLFLALAMAISFIPIPAYSETTQELDTGSSSEAVEPDCAIPTDEQLENAAPNQLIITYANDALDINDKLEVATLDGSTLKEVAKSSPNEQTTLSEIGAISTDSISERDGDCEIPTSSLITFEDGTDIQEASAQLLSSPEITSVQPNFKYELFSIGSTSYHDATFTNDAKHATNDPYSYVDETKELNQSYIYTTKIADAWAAGYKSENTVTIAVIDAGVRLDHPDLSRVWDKTNARDFTTTSSGSGVPYVDSPANWLGRTGYACHGTWVSGVVGAAANNGIGIAGTSYNAKILPIKVTNGGSLYTSTIVRAYDYLDSLIENGKVSTLKVINLSLGGREADPDLNSAITHLSKAHNVLTVASAGNYGDNDHMYPADFTNVLSVMATDSDFERAFFSNYGGKDVSAPGTDITTTIPWSRSWSNSDFGKYSKDGIDGTSFSSPIVAGIAALCYSVKPSARFDEVKWAIKSGATSLASIDKTCAPYVNAFQAVKNVLNGTGFYEATHTSISSIKVSSISAKTYTGKRIMPTPKVTRKGKKLTKGVDYTLTYSYNLLPGKATITIKGKGAYKGSKIVTFKILPKASKIVSLKAGYYSIKVKWKRQQNCASGYQVRYSTSNARYSSKKLKHGKTITISGKTKNTIILSQLNSYKRYYVQVRTYKKSCGVKYYSKWSSIYKVRVR